MKTDPKAAVDDPTTAKAQAGEKARAAKRRDDGAPQVGSEVILVTVTNPNATLRRTPARVVNVEAESPQGPVLTVVFSPPAPAGALSSAPRPKDVTVSGVVPHGSRAYPCWEPCAD